MQQGKNHYINQWLQWAMFISMGLAISILLIAAHTTPVCQAKQIVASRNAGQHTYYAFADGTGTWSVGSFSVGDRVCLQ